MTWAIPTNPTFARENQHFAAYKQAKRREDDIAIVNAAFNVTLAGGKIERLRMAFGGMAPTTKLGVNTSKQLQGQQWERGLVDTACGLLAEEFHLPPDVPGGMVR